MQFPTKYKCLSQNEYLTGDFKIIPIRFEDRIVIMKWRNEQMYHLRQDKPLTEKSQDNYFNGILAKLFNQEKPGQILFSFLKNGECIGYGGLVHINWIDKNAEISFIMNTKLEKNYFLIHWQIFLKIVEQVAFNDLKFYKLYTYAFDLRPHLYETLEEIGWTKEAVLKKHFYLNKEFKNIIIHSKFNNNY